MYGPRIFVGPGPVRLQIFNIPSSSGSISDLQTLNRSVFSKMYLVLVWDDPGIFGFGPVINFSNLFGPGPVLGP